MFPRPLTRMSDWTVRTKLVVVMVPLALAMLGLAGQQIVAQETTHGDLIRAQRALEVGARAWEVTDALQDERSAVMSFIHSGRRDTAPLVEAVQRVDAAKAALRMAAGEAEQLAPVVRAGAEKALTELDGLDALRRTVQQTRYPDVSAHTRYSEIVDVLVRTGRGTADSVSTLPVGSDVAAIQSLGAAQEHLATQNAILLAAAYTRDLPPQQANQLRAAQSRFDAAVDEFNAAADPDLRQRYQDTVSGADVDERSRLTQLALVQSGANRPITVAAADAVRTGKAATTRITAVRSHVTADVVTMTDALSAVARRATLVVGGLIATVLLIAFAVAALIARSILRPLHVLRRTALYVAKHDLPNRIARILDHPDPLTAAKSEIDAVPIHSREEVGQVARAFDTVYNAAVHHAAAHAVLRDGVNAIFVNLARRSQALVERQITTIDQLEQDEQNPDQLAALFELDHLATRMRRNSENLLVLSGAGLSTRLVNPVPLHDVLGAAVSEAENYARVTTDACEVAVLGHAAKDLAHLLAELLDNATALSDPATKVRLRGALTRTKDLVIEVRDCGIGMDEKQIEQINRQLRQPPDLDVRMAERMGLHVVGRLAQRHGITVTLRANDDLDEGVTAKVLVPATLFVAPRPHAVTVEHTPETPAAPRPEPAVVNSDVDLFQPAHPADHATTVPRGLTPLTRRTRAGQASGAQAGTSQTHSSGAGTPQSADDGHEADREPATQRLAPFKDVLSQWFTSPQGIDSGHAGTAGNETGRATDTATPSTDSGTALAETSAPRRTFRASSAAAQWASPGDPGWHAANTILAAATPDLQPPGGLPKRVPKARLMPGSPLAPNAAPAPAIDPQLTRHRLATFQQGVQRARNEAGPPKTENPSTEVTDR